MYNKKHDDNAEKIICHPLHAHAHTLTQRAYTRWANIPFVDWCTVCARGNGIHFHYFVRKFVWESQRHKSPKENLVALQQQQHQQPCGWYCGSSFVSCAHDANSRQPKATLRCADDVCARVCVRNGCVYVCASLMWMEYRKTPESRVSVLSESLTELAANSESRTAPTIVCYFEKSIECERGILCVPTEQTSDRQKSKNHPKKHTFARLTNRIRRNIYFFALEINETQIFSNSIHWKRPKQTTTESNLRAKRMKHIAVSGSPRNRQQFISFARM